MQRPPLMIQHDEREVFPECSQLDCHDQWAQTWAYVTSGISGLTNLPIFDSPTSAVGDAEWNCRPKCFLVCDVCCAISLLDLSKLYSKQTLKLPQNFNFETPYCCCLPSHQKHKQVLLTTENGLNWEDKQIIAHNFALNASQYWPYLFPGLWLMLALSPRGCQNRIPSLQVGGGSCQQAEIKVEPMFLWLILAEWELG